MLLVLKSWFVLRPFSEWLCLQALCCTTVQESHTVIAYAGHWCCAVGAAGRPPFPLFDCDSSPLLLYSHVCACCVAHLQAVVSPGGVGFDINCGVRLIRTNLTLADVEPVKEQLAQVGRRQGQQPAMNWLLHMYRTAAEQHCEDRTWLRMVGDLVTGSTRNFSCSLYLCSSSSGKSSRALPLFPLSLSLSHSISLFYFHNTDVCCPAWPLWCPVCHCVCSPCLTTSLLVLAARASSPQQPRTWRQHWRWAWTGACGEQQ